MQLSDQACNSSPAEDLEKNLDYRRSKRGSSSPRATCPVYDGILADGSTSTKSASKPVQAIGGFELLSAAWNILNSWFGFGCVFIVGLSHGGPVTLIYGMALLSLIYACTGMSLAELAAKFPSAGGQYHWTAILAPRHLKRSLSYACGMCNIVGRLTICAAVILAIAQFILGIIAFNLSTYTIERWHVVAVYHALNVANLLYNAYALHRMSWTHHAGCALSIASFLIIIIVCLSLSDNKQPAIFVWGTFIDKTGWENPFIVFLTGLVCPNFGLGGLDGPVHLAEDTFEPRRTVPRSILVSIVMGGISATVFVIAMLYCISDVPTLLTSRTGVPLFEMWYQATRSPTWTNFFMALFTAVGILTVVGSVATGSRLVMSYARDNALLGSRIIRKIDPKQGTPINAMVYSAFWIAVLGCLYMASSTAFNSLCGMGVLVEQWSFVFPFGLLMWRRRAARFLPPNGSFNWGRSGWVLNAVAVTWPVLASVFFCLPSEMPVTSGNMNYSPVALTIAVLLTTANWYFYAAKHYHGPEIDVFGGSGVTSKDLNHGSFK